MLKSGFGVFFEQKIFFDRRVPPLKKKILGNFSKNFHFFRKSQKGLKWSDSCSKMVLGCFWAKKVFFKNFFENFSLFSKIPKSLKMVWFVLKIGFYVFLSKKKFSIEGSPLLIFFRKFFRKFFFPEKIYKNMSKMSEKSWIPNPLTKIKSDKK